MSKVKELAMKREFKRAVTPETPCEARQISDQMNCQRCGLVWDMNDPEPPQCKRRQDPKPSEPVASKTLETGKAVPASPLGSCRSHAKNWVDAKREEWSQKDRSVGLAHLEKLRGKIKA